jgi:hypothetical protein
MISPETDEDKVIIVGLGWEPTNIWAVRFNFHGLIYSSAWLTDEYGGRWADGISPSIFVG